MTGNDVPPTPIELKAPSDAELAALSRLALRSKAHWGYDAQFMAACVGPLTLTPASVAGGRLAVIRDGAGFAAFAQISAEGREGHLDKLFVDPAAMGRGHGATLYRWALAALQAEGATLMLIEADPGAAPFYARMGAVQVGEAASEAIPGRMLPLLRHDL